MDERSLRIMKKRGYDYQSRQIVEEMSELMQALNKYWRYDLKGGTIPYEEAVKEPTPTRLSVIEELADVKVCLSQMIHFFNCEDKVLEIENQKLNRAIKSIEFDESLCL